ncbi:uncharacterized protein LOC102803732 [Saccoglossus kowalevskii]|uniref:TIMELESS-interacting protein n=1 Tax=Saccoglossus kowalevskii TaxID=10224 RepID=A0ABM0MGD6_SACKO|nr:PREDICTED: TIMELESS-interacting protein-like [Saccoglossus kowalevskii]
MMATSIDLLDNFHDNDMDEEEIEEFPPLPEMPSLSPRRSDDDAEDDRFVSQALKESSTDAVEAALEDIPTAKVARIVNRKPQPKLDANRLIDPERGIPSIPKQFSKLKFKGKGHEVSDLKVMMQAYEHWAHRLYPKMTFDDVIEKVEQLGHKKPVQVTLTKLRLDMPLTDDDFVMRHTEEQGQVEGDNTELASLVERNSSQVDFLQHNSEMPSQSPPSTPLPMTTVSTPPSSQSIKKGTLTEEQLERIERNKRLARERRESKMKAGTPITSSQTERAPITSSQNEGAPITSSQTEGAPITSSQTEGAPITSSQTEGAPITSSQTEGAPITSSQTEGAPITSSQTEGTPITASQDVTLETCDSKESSDHNTVNERKVENIVPKTAERKMNKNLDNDNVVSKERIDKTDERDSDDEMETECRLVIDQSAQGVETERKDDENVAMETEQKITNHVASRTKFPSPPDSQTASDKNELDEAMEVENIEKEISISQNESTTSSEM